MKTIKTTPINKISKMVFALVAVAVTLTSCKKDDEIAPTPEPLPEQVEALTSGNWVLEAVDVNGNDVKNSYMDDCELDDITIFKTDGTYVTDEGDIKCDPNSKQTNSGVWEFAKDYTKLVVDKEHAMYITLLTKKEMHTVDTTYEDGSMYITKLKFSSK